MFHMQNLASSLSPACLAAQADATQRWRCLLAEHAARYVTSDLFIMVPAHHAPVTRARWWSPEHFGHPEHFDSEGTLSARALWP